MGCVPLSATQCRNLPSSNIGYFTHLSPSPAEVKPMTRCMRCGAQLREATVCRPLWAVCFAIFPVVHQLARASIAYCAEKKNGIFSQWACVFKPTHQDLKSTGLGRLAELGVYHLAVLSMQYVTGFKISGCECDLSMPFALPFHFSQPFTQWCI